MLRHETDEEIVFFFSQWWPKQIYTMHPKSDQSYSFRDYGHGIFSFKIPHSGGSFAIRNEFSAD